jgi:DNA-binding SARP family transcriptional activator
MSTPRSDESNRTRSDVTESATGSPPHYALRLLGAFELRGADNDVLLSAGKPLALVAYLSSVRGRRAPRATLTAVIWGESDSKLARQSLRQTVFALRQRFGPEFLEGDGEWLSLTVAVTNDAEWFARAVEMKQYDEAIAMYRGEFIPGFAAPGAAEFERWCDMERLRLRNAYIASAIQHIPELTQRDGLDASIALATRVRDMDPDDDAHWQRLIELLALAGKRVEMRVEAAALRATRAEDGATIDLALERLLAKLHGESSSALETLVASAGAVYRSAEPEFQGRAAVFAALLSAWALATQSRPQQRLIVAPAGFGKTRLIGELRLRLLSQRVRSIVVAARRSERDDPYAFGADVVAELANVPGAAGIAPASAAVLAGLVPALSDRFHVTAEAVGDYGPELLRRRVLALADLLASILEDRSIAILLDDLHWADAESVRMLQRALARIDAARVMVVATSRTPVPLFSSEDQQLMLEPLSVDDVGGIVRSIAKVTHENLPDRTIEQLRQIAGGSPFMVLQLLRLAVDHQLLHVTGESWHVPDVAALESFLQQSSSVRWRLSAVAEQERGVLASLAVADAPLTEDVISAATQTSRRASHDALYALESAGFVVRHDDTTWAMAHALITDDIVDALPEELRRSAQRALGEVLAPLARDLAALRRVVRLLIAGDASPLALRAIADWIARNPSSQATPDLLISQLLGAGADDAFAAQLRRLARRGRPGWKTPVFVAAATMLVTVLVGGWALLRPAALVSVGGLGPTDVQTSDEIFPIAPQFELRNSLGLRSRSRDGDTVRIGAMDAAPPLRGRTFAVLHDGVAEFDSLYPATESQLVGFRLHLLGVPDLVLRSPARADSLAIVSAEFDGERLSDGARVLRVAPGARIDGTVRFRYSTLNRSALYVLANTTTWGAIDRDTLTVRSLLAGISNALVSVPVARVAPVQRGDYWLLWSQGAEPSAGWLLSGTNWACHRPHWNDGNDLAALPSSTLSTSVERGAFTVKYEFCGRGPIRIDKTMPLAGIRVEVR